VTQIVTMALASAAMPLLAGVGSTAGSASTEGVG
jgi:hypothetical protein